MIDELWNEVVARLSPTLICFSDDEGIGLSRQITELVEYPYATVNWKKYPKHFRFYEVFEIIPLLERLLDRPFDDTVYVYAPDNYIGFLKVPLRKFLAGRYMVLHPMWLWNPVEGYMIEERNGLFGTVGLIKKMEDPLPRFVLKKDTFPEGYFDFRYFFRFIFLNFGVDFITDYAANKILASFREIVPLTYWGWINWDRIENRIILGTDQDRIIPELTRLLGDTFDRTVYIEWCDEELPLAKMALENVLKNYRQTIELSVETILFNLEAGYIIEIDASRIITVGLLPRNNL